MDSVASPVDEQGSTGLDVVIERLAGVQALDGVADPVHRVLRQMPEGAATLLRGRWLGHPVHPVLTDLAIGFWTSAWVLDMVGGTHSEGAADALVGLGVVSAVPTVATGWADWVTLPRSQRRIGVVHAVSNAAATSLFAASWLARRNGARGRGVALCHAGAAVATVGGMLGGHLAFAGSPSAGSPNGSVDQNGHGPGAVAPSRIAGQDESHQ